MPQMDGLAGFLHSVCLYHLMRSNRAWGLWIETQDLSVSPQVMTCSGATWDLVTYETPNQERRKNHYRSVWTVTTSVACSTPQEGEEEVLPHPRAASAVATARLAITIPDPSETEAWRRRNRTPLRWWTAFRRSIVGGPSHLDTHSETHTHDQPVINHCRV